MKDVKTKFVTAAAVLVVCCLLVQVGVTQETTEEIRSRRAKDLTPQEQTERKLAQKIGKLELGNIPLEEAIQFMRDLTGASIVVKWNTLKDYGIEGNSSVELHMLDVPASRGLQGILDAVSGQLKLAYEIDDDGVVIISTYTDLSSHLVTRTYKIGDLLFRTHMTFAELHGELWTGSRLTDLDSGEKAPPPAESDKSGEEPTTKPEQAKIRILDFAERSNFVTANQQDSHGRPGGIVGLIVDTIDRKTWHVNGGDLGGISLLNDSLVVTHNRVVHRKIEKLLTDLRESCNLRVGVAVVRVNDDSSRKKLDELVAKSGDVAAALQQGEADGLWTLDRCEVEKLAFGQVVLATDIHEHKLASADGAITTLTGYEIGVLPKAAAEDGGMLFSAACASAWYPAGHDPATDTPEKNAGVTKRHNVCDFILPAGGAKVIPVIPADSKPGCVRLVVWLPAHVRPAMDITETVAE